MVMCGLLSMLLSGRGSEMKLLMIQKLVNYLQIYKILLMPILLHYLQIYKIFKVILMLILIKIGNMKMLVIHQSAHYLQLYKIYKILLMPIIHLMLHILSNLKISGISSKMIYNNNLQI